MHVWNCRFPRLKNIAKDFLRFLRFWKHLISSTVKEIQDIFGAFLPKISTPRWKLLTLVQFQKAAIVMNWCWRAIFTQSGITMGIKILKIVNFLPCCGCTGPPAQLDSHIHRVWSLDHHFVTDWWSEEWLVSNNCLSVTNSLTNERESFTHNPSMKWNRSENLTILWEANVSYSLT